jgi:2-polyprenyl-3-methyl-5-hydroxy-6-metoxy-1,4-benzoquinol methylase
VTTDDPIAVNREHWNALAAVHGNGTDSYYDVDALLAGRSSMTRHERTAVEAEIGDQSGRDVMHVQCHIGFESISLARAGARVTGVDLSPVALAKAARLAARCGVEVEFVEGNAMDLPVGLHARFDLAYATIGVLGWIGDVDAWMRSVAACLRPGGKLVVVEIHPLFGMIKSLEPFEMWAGYAFSGPHVDGHALPVLFTLHATRPS